MKKHILIVEDEEELATSLKERLVNEEFSVIVVNNGKQAIKNLRWYSFDLILLDILMPVFGGMEVLNYVQEEQLDIPIFILSNLDEQQERNKAFKAGAEKYFVKSETSLEKIVEEMKKRLS